MNTEENNWSKKRIYLFIASVLLFLTGTIFYLNVQQSTSAITKSKLYRIDSLIISEAPVIIEVKGRDPHSYIKFKCVGYPKRFDIDNFDFHCSDKAKILNINLGDIISIGILKSDFNDIKNETFLSKSNNIHSLVYNNMELIDLNCRNKKSTRDNYLFFIFCYIMTPLTLLMGLFKKKPLIDPAIVLCILGVIIIIVLQKYF